jgi:MFS family permease
MLFGLRLVLGMGESVAFPSYSKIIALHFPEEHRGLANSVVSAGLMLGPGLGMLIGGMLMARFGWRPFFIVLGSASLLWLIPWIKWMPVERNPIHLDTTGAPSLPEFLRLRSAWGTCVGLFCGNYVNYFLITWLPFYMVRERHFSMDTMAKVGGTAYLLGAGFSMLSGWLSDRWIMSGGTPTQVRKTFTGAGIALAGISLGLSAISGPILCLAMLVLGVFFSVLAVLTSGQSHRRLRVRKPQGDGQASRISSAIWQGSQHPQSLDSSWTEPGISTGLSRS